ncbi:MAG: EAL domain-containing protein [Planctomycetota bacterium]
MSPDNDSIPQETCARRRVLFVDDEPEVTRSVRLALRKESFKILTANSAKEGLELLAEGGIDVVVSDERMPEMGGSEFLSIVKERHPETIRLILSGQASLESAVDAINDAGIYRFLLKPCKPEELAFCLGQALQAVEERRAYQDWESQSGVEARATLGETLDQALGALHMVFQPIVHAREQSVFGYEALVRVSAGVTDPGALFALAEELDRVQDVERKIRTLIGERLPELPEGASLLVNIHPQSLSDEDLFEVAGPLAKHSSKVVIEITERDSVHDVPDLQAQVARLRELGFRIAVDDLGAGYAGLTSFALLCPDIVKFDLELIQGIHDAPTKAKLVASFNALCREMEILTIAEGVELDEERECVVGLHCDLIQGFFFAKPSPDFLPAGAVLEGQ